MRIFRCLVKLNDIKIHISGHVIVCLISMLAAESIGITINVCHPEVFQDIPVNTAIAEINNLLCCLLIKIELENAHGRRVISPAVNTISMRQIIRADPFVILRIK